MKSTIVISCLTLCTLFPLSAFGSEDDQIKSISVLRLDVPHSGQLLKQYPGFKISYSFPPNHMQPPRMITARIFKNHCDTHTPTISSYSLDICQGTALDDPFSRLRIESSNEHSSYPTVSLNQYRISVQVNLSPLGGNTRYQSKEAFIEKVKALGLAAGARCLVSNKLASQKLVDIHFRQKMLEKNLLYLVDWINKPKVRSAIIQLSRHWGSNCRTAPSKQLIEQIAYPAIQD